MTIRLALDALLRNRSRSLLTMLGVIIGVAAVIVTVAIDTGASTSVAQQISSLGSNMIIVLPGSVTAQGVRSGFGGSSTLTPNDGLAIAQLPGVAGVSPGVGMRVQAVSGQNNWQTSLAGVAPTYTFIRDWRVDEGVFFSQNDTLSASKVCVLGQTVVRNLFPDGASPIGKTVTMRGVPFTVIGTMSARGQSGLGQDQDDTIIVPYTSAMQRLTGQTTYVGMLMVSATDAQRIDSVQSEIVSLLEQRHRIVPPTQDDFSVRNLADIAAAASSAGAVMQLLLASVAAVSLVVGGIGIMNIMLVSVTERTREIGLRRSVGARASLILRQFLTESVVLSTVGGLIGILVGLVGTAMVAQIAKWPMTIPPQWILIAALFSLMVGVFFGYYPARKASHLNPIEALRFE
ncbi:MAG TPA: ABC transporter permease [Candidatus Baltobacteraceae bacterium]|nr:ABC transporter permease [Candidatus Baltobacteraceae bacterium]